MKLNEEQEAAVSTFMDFMLDDTQSHMLLTGSAGCGKSTTVRAMLESVDKQMKLLSVIMGKGVDQSVDVKVTASTNKAARVIADLTGEEPKTIHSLLGLRVMNDFKTGKTKLQKTKDYKVYQDTLLIIDEASFIDSFLLKEIFAATKHCKTLFVGDSYQLAPTFESKPPVFDLDITKAELTKVMRTDKDIIATNSNNFKDSVRTGLFKDITYDTDSVIQVEGEEFKKLVDEHFVYSHNKPDTSKILCWTNGRVHQYNNHIRKLQGRGNGLEIGEVVVTNKPIVLNSGLVSTDTILTVTDSYQAKPQYEQAGSLVTLNDRYTVFVPDDLQAALALQKYYGKQKAWHDYFTIKDQWGDLRPIHCSTVHKSQGSTYENVFLDLSDIGSCNIPMDVARMMYVAISRASNKVYVYGELPTKYRG